MINYYNESLKILETLSQEKKKPRLLLHACCAPCSVFPLQWLNSHFDITLYYANSNIYPSSEYEKRKEELRHYIKKFNATTSSSIQLVVPPYESDKFIQMSAPLAQEPEGGKRCTMCYEMRLEDSFCYAKKCDFDYVSTVMSISRHKDSQRLNQLGLELANKYAPVAYFTSDFKKKDGQLIAKELSKLHQLYRQDYCGCIYSLQENLRRNEKE
ncbi:MAG: epoxyqueuosine reductase QueH [Anaerorhabdus sp.]